MSSESKYVGPPQPHARLIAGKELIPKGDGFVYSILLLIDQKMSILHHKKKFCMWDFSRRDMACYICEFPQSTSKRKYKQTEPERGTLISK